MRAAADNQPGGPYKGADYRVSAKKKQWKPGASCRVRTRGKVEDRAANIRIDFLRDLENKEMLGRAEFVAPAAGENT